MRTGRDDEKISLPFNIDKPWMKRAVFLDFSAHLLITAFANSHLTVLRQMLTLRSQPISNLGSLAMPASLPSAPLLAIPQGSFRFARRAKL